MSHIKTLATRFVPLMQRFQLAEEAGGFIVYEGELMQIISLALVGDQVVVEMTPAQYGAFEDVWVAKAA